MYFLKVFLAFDESSNANIAEKIKREPGCKSSIMNVLTARAFATAGKQDMKGPLNHSKLWWQRSAQLSASNLNLTLSLADEGSHGCCVITGKLIKHPMLYTIWI